MVCICGHDDHSWNEPTVCKNIDCKCIKYVEADEKNIVLSRHVIYIRQFESVQKQVAWLLENLKYLRNFKNKDFIDFYFSHIRVFSPRGSEPREPDYETIRRTRQLLAARMPDTYGPFDPETISERNIKQYAIEEFVTQ